MFKEVAYNPCPGDTLNFPGGSRIYVVDSVDGDELVVRRTIIRNGDPEEPAQCVEVIYKWFWSDLVRFACTVERTGDKYHS